MTGMPTDDEILAVRNLQLVSESTCHFITDAAHVRLGTVRTIIDAMTQARQRIEVIGIAESRLTGKCRSYVMGRRLAESA
jgi:hypothetical protein